MNFKWKYPLVRDTIDETDIKKLIDWLQTNPRLTKGEQTIKFENAWSKWQDSSYSVFVNSGSSANLAMLYALQLSGRMKNNKVIVPTVSWVTTVAPVMQLGMEPILCEPDKETLGVDIDHLKSLIKVHNPAALIIVHVLGVPNKMDDIVQLCQENDIHLLEDSCESVGSTYRSVHYDNKEMKTGNFGILSSFSTYFGHHFSTIEGGIINTKDEELYHILLSIRSHGWDRDLPEKEKDRLRKLENVSDFRAMYTFYYPGFNLRSTDLQAFIGLGQLERLDDIVYKRNKNFLTYQNLYQSKYWKIQNCERSFISNFAYPIILHKNYFDKAIKKLTEYGVETRPLVCGSIGEQPFWKNKYTKESSTFSNKIHHYGMYLPNNPNMTSEDIEYICDILKNKIK